MRGGNASGDKPASPPAPGDEARLSPDPGPGPGDVSRPLAGSAPQAGEGEGSHHGGSHHDGSHHGAPRSAFAGLPELRHDF